MTFPPLAAAQGCKAELTYLVVTIPKTAIGIDPKVDRGTFPPFLKWRDALCFVLLFFRR